MKDNAAMELLSELGADLLINNYVLNFKTNGVLNKSIHR